MKKPPVTAISVSSTKAGKATLATCFVTIEVPLEVERAILHAS